MADRAAYHCGNVSDGCYDLLTVCFTLIYLVVNLLYAETGGA